MRIRAADWLPTVAALVWLRVPLADGGNWACLPNLPAERSRVGGILGDPINRPLRYANACEQVRFALSEHTPCAFRHLQPAVLDAPEKTMAPLARQGACKSSLILML